LIAIFTAERLGVLPEIPEVAVGASPEKYRHDHWLLVKPHLTTALANRGIFFGVFHGFFQPKIFQPSSG
jgi:hypothetical protein